MCRFLPVLSGRARRVISSVRETFHALQMNLGTLADLIWALTQQKFFCGRLLVAVSIGAELFASRDGVEVECLKTDVSGRMLTNPLSIAQLSITVSIKGNASAEKLEGLVRESFEASPIVGSLKVKPQLIVKTE